MISIKKERVQTARKVLSDKLLEIGKHIRAEVLLEPVTVKPEQTLQAVPEEETNSDLKTILEKKMHRPGANFPIGNCQLAELVIHLAVEMLPHEK